MPGRGAGGGGGGDGRGGPLRAQGSPLTALALPASPASPQMWILVGAIVIVICYAIAAFICGAGLNTGPCATKAAGK